MQVDCSQVSSMNRSIHMGNKLLFPQIDMLSEKKPEMLLRQESSKCREPDYHQI